MLLTIKELSVWLNIKPSTLYLWAAQGKIPCQKIHGLIRFDRQKIEDWLDSFQQRPPVPVPSFSHTSYKDVDRVIEAAKRDAYTPCHGETRPTASPKGKEVDRGAR
jgi:excisionase family DNA binding protein